MSTDQLGRDDDDSRRKPATGAGIGVGTALGMVAFAMTQDLIWIAIGAALGVVMGAAIPRCRR